MFRFWFLTYKPWFLAVFVFLVLVVSGEFWVLVVFMVSGLLWLLIKFYWVLTVFGFWFLVVFCGFGGFCFFGFGV